MSWLNRRRSKLPAGANQVAGASNLSPPIPGPGVQVNNQQNVNSVNATMFRNSGDQKAAVGDYISAITFYSEAITLMPSAIDLRIRRALAYALRSYPSDDAQSLEDIKVAIRVDPTNWVAWKLKGDQHVALNQLQEAEESYRNAIGCAKDLLDKLQIQRNLRDVQILQAPTQTLPIQSPISNVTSQTASPSSSISRNIVSPPPMQPMQPSTAPLQTPNRSPVSGTGIQQPINVTQPTMSNLTPPSTTQSPRNVSAPPIIPLFSTVGASGTTHTNVQPSMPVTQRQVSSSSQASSTLPTQPIITPQRTTPSSPANPSTQNVTTPPINVISSVEETPSDPPPEYSANSSLLASQSRNLSVTEIENRISRLNNQLAPKQKGKIKLSVYKTTDAIEALVVLYEGLTTTELTERERPTPRYLHTSHRNVAIELAKYPGNIFMDIDPECLASYDGKYPGTASIHGYSEEYRAYQLKIAPLLKLTLESNESLPVVDLDKIMDQLVLIQSTATIEQNESLKSLLGLSQVSQLQHGFGAGGTLQKRIDGLCMLLSRSFYDEPTRFRDFSKAPPFTSLLLSANLTTRRDFLYQVLLGAELLLRLRMQATLTPLVSYTSYITEYSSTLMVLADLFMLNVQSTKTLSLTGTGYQYKFVALNHRENANGLLRFAEALSWPFVDEAREVLETAYSDLVGGSTTVGWDLRDWLFGLVLPGKFFRHRIMSALVNASPSTRDFRSAPFYDDGIIVAGKSYWPKRSVLGKVFGGKAFVQSVCGWIGPIPAPTGNLKGWISLNARALDTPVPITTSQDNDPLEELGYPFMNGETRLQKLDAITSVEEYITPITPTTPQGPPSCKFKDLILESVSQATVGRTAEERTYRPSLNFDILGKTVKYTLYTNPMFVTAPPCRGNHPLFRRQAEVLLKDAVMAKDLKEKHPVGDKLFVINAMSDGDELVARAWCAERGKHAIVRRNTPGFECCFACASNFASKRTGLGVNVLIWSKA